MHRFAPLAVSGLTAVAVSISGCYTKLGLSDPYEHPGYNGGWTEVYYVVVPWMPWEPCPGHHSWYERYYRPWEPSYAEDWDGTEIGRHRNDRGPGTPAGVVTGGGAAPPAPTGAPPQPPPTTDPRNGDENTNPTRARAGSDDATTKKEETTEPTRAGRRR